VTRRRIQPKPKVEVETVSLRLPAQLIRAVDQYAKYLRGSNDRTYVITQAIEIASSRKTAVVTPALSASHGGPSLVPRQ
jgi:hypothetical protein